MILTKIIFNFFVTLIFPLASAFADDGKGLPTKPPAFSKAELDAIYAEGKMACDSGCVTPFETVLGSADGVEAKSNCKSECITSKYLFLNTKQKTFSVFADDPKKPDEFYVGMVYQCIEYSRRWWLQNFGLSYGSVDGADEILYLNDAIKVTGEKVPLVRHINGSAKQAPKRGDLVVYGADRKVKEWRFGHVAVVVNSEPRRGFIEVAEENYDNKMWRGKTYARRLKLIHRKFGLLITDDEITNKSKPEHGTGTITGWISIAAP